MTVHATRLVAVTGGTGFLGGYVISALAAAGWRIRVLARHAPDRPPLTRLKSEVVRGDLSDPAALKRLVEGADTVIHVAALVTAPTAAAFRTVNVGGTANLLSAVTSYAPATRFVMVSSMAAREPSLSAYAATKRAGEEVLTVVSGSSLDWIIVRPCAIYGPGDTGTLVFFRAVNWRIVPCPRERRARITLVHARDAAAAIVGLCEGGPSHVIFEITDARRDGYSWREIVATAARAMETKVVVLPVPGLAVRCAAVTAMVSALLYRRAPILTLGKAREILHSDWTSSASRQPPPVLWQPRVDLSEGFGEAVHWYRREHWLR